MLECRRIAWIILSSTPKAWRFCSQAAAESREIWGAEDREQGVLYLYSEHYRAHEEPHVYTEAINAQGKWIPGVIDPASRGRSQRDATQLIELYRKAGLNIEAADNAVEGGIYACEQLMSADRLKVFTSLSNWYQAFRLTGEMKTAGS
jgi:hypothetical protein